MSNLVLPPESTRTLSVRATVVPGTPLENLYYSDRSVAGSYTFEVPRHLVDEEAAACAMGFFHTTVPVKYLADFEFKVVDQNGNELEPDYDLDWYKFSERFRHLRPKSPFEIRHAEVLALLHQQDSST
jgi:hypothetical protein